MKIKDKIIVVTGGGHGIGKAMCQRFARESAGAIVVVDLDEASAQNVASEIGGLSIGADVSSEDDLIKVVRITEKEYGKIDLFCSNAGVLFRDEPDWMVTSCANELWQKSWEVNVMAHVYAARAVLPGMIKRWGGYLLHTVSAAGLLSQIGSAPYSTTKHAAMGFATSLAITHGVSGIKVSVLCPEAVRTDMIKDSSDNTASIDGILEPDDVAESVIKGLNEEQFLILPHDQVQTYILRKASDIDRWIKAMQRLRESANFDETKS